MFFCGESRGEWVRRRGESPRLRAWLAMRRSALRWSVGLLASPPRRMRVGPTSNCGFTSSTAHPFSASTRGILGRMKSREMNETSHTMASTGALSMWASWRCRALSPSVQATRGSARSAGRSWSWPTSMAYTRDAPWRSAHSVNPPVEAPMSSTRRLAKEREKARMAFSSFSPPWLAKAGVGGCNISILSLAPTVFAGVWHVMPLIATRPSRMASLAFTREGKEPIAVRCMSNRVAMLARRYVESCSAGGGERELIVFYARFEVLLFSHDFFGGERTKLILLT